MLQRASRGCQAHFVPPGPTARPTFWRRRATAGWWPRCLASSSPPCASWCWTVTLCRSSPTRPSTAGVRPAPRGSPRAGCSLWSLLRARVAFVPSALQSTGRSWLCSTTPPSTAPWLPAPRWGTGPATSWAACCPGATAWCTSGRRWTVPSRPRYAPRHGAGCWDPRWPSWRPREVALRCPRAGV